MEHITEHPGIKVDVERFGVYDTPEHGLMLRLVYRRSDDGRRMTSFYVCDKTSCETLYAILQQVAPSAAK